MEEKIQQRLGRLDEVEALLSTEEVARNVKEFKKLSSEHARLFSLKQTYDTLLASKSGIQESKELLESESDSEMRSMLKEEIDRLEVAIPILEKELVQLLVPPDPDDHRNVILELRAGTGGEEAALFVADCVRMYRMYSDSKGWQFQTINISEAEMGGLREAIFSVKGENVFKYMKFEAGIHRVQRVPKTEAQGRIHTSTITVAIMPEPDEEEEIELNDKDLQIDTYRSSGAGGQHVNTTDSAVRITHLPTGLAVYCQEERSQIKNRVKAMTLLKARMMSKQREERDRERSKLRQDQVGTGERSEKIRTYNYPQNRFTDHRVNFSSYNLDRVMEGNLDEVTDVLLSDEAARALSEAD
ncbi:MAG: peptide chain release factor 1 [Chlamydiia bacterium]